MWIKWFSSHLTSLLCWCIWLFQGNLKAGFTLKHGATHSRSPERLNWLFHSEFSPNFGLNSDLKQTKRRLLYLFLYLYTYIQSFTNKHSGWVHTYANWMRVSPQQICMTRECDWLSMESVHTSPVGRPRRALQKGPVHLWLRFRSEFRQKFRPDSPLKGRTGTYRTPCCEPLLILYEPSLMSWQRIPKSL